MSGDGGEITATRGETAVAGGLAGISGADDAELLRLTPSCVEAFGVFYDRYEGEVLAFFWRRTRRADLAADLTSEVFARALESAARFDGKLGSARTWLYTLAQRLLTDTWRHGQVESAARERLQMQPLVVDDEFLAAVERIAAAQSDVLGLLDELPGEQRAAVEGRVLDELDYPELSCRLRCSESVVRKRVSRGLRTLRSLIDQDEREEETR